MIELLKEIVSERKLGRNRGIVSICSANPIVLEAIMEEAKECGKPLLIESTANQVNQYGGYMRMRPIDFFNYVHKLAEQKRFSKNKIFLGGDHLGPLPWMDLPESQAMNKAKELVKEYVSSGFRKIHIDTTIKLKEDKELNFKKIVERSLKLIKVCEDEFNKLCSEKKNERLTYVIGSEVPFAGGLKYKEKEIVSRKKDLKEMIFYFKKGLSSKGLNNVWNRIVAIVVHPGVEFGEDEIRLYNRNKILELKKELESEKDKVFECHSTDYQPKEYLRALVKDGFVILKVGPALTKALTESFYALSCIEEILKDKFDKKSKFNEILDIKMEQNPGYWEDYHDSKISRKFSFLDRSRYYLSCEDVKESIDILLENLNKVKIPLYLIHQYFPREFDRVLTRKIGAVALELTKERIKNVYRDYLFAIE